MPRTVRQSKELRAIASLQRRAREDRARIQALEANDAANHALIHELDGRTHAVEVHLCGEILEIRATRISDPVGAGVSRTVGLLERVAELELRAPRSLPPLPTNSTPPSSSAFVGTALARARAFFRSLWRP